VNEKTPEKKQQKENYLKNQKKKLKQGRKARKKIPFIQRMKSLLKTKY